MSRLSKNLQKLAIESHFGLSVCELATVVGMLGSDLALLCLATAKSVTLVEQTVETASSLGHLACQVHLNDYVVEKAAIDLHVSGRRLCEGGGCSLWVAQDPPQPRTRIGPHSGALDGSCG